MVERLPSVMAILDPDPCADHPEDCTPIGCERCMPFIRVPCERCGWYPTPEAEA